MRGNKFPWHWVFEPYAPLQTKLIVATDLGEKLTGRADREKLLEAARTAIMTSGKGYDINDLSFRFRDLTIAISSSLEQGRWLTIRAGVAPRTKPVPGTSGPEP